MPVIKVQPVFQVISGHGEILLLLISLIVMVLVYQASFKMFVFISVIVALTVNLIWPRVT